LYLHSTRHTGVFIVALTSARLYNQQAAWHTGHSALIVGSDGPAEVGVVVWVTVGVSTGNRGAAAGEQADTNTIIIRTYNPALIFHHSFPHYEVSHVNTTLIRSEAIFHYFLLAALL